MRKAGGFTLIELLIVVAIIAILAAIAIPNFLAAQIRAKVAKAKGSERSLATALEAYRVDENDYPPDEHPPGSNLAGGVRVLFRITTPVAYITSIPRDSFFYRFNASTYPNYVSLLSSGDYLYRGPRVIDYWINAGVTFDRMQGSTPNSRWLLVSPGPDNTTDAFAGWTEYDPTNGTVSPGAIQRWGP